MDETTRRGQLSINRVSSNTSDDFVRIELVDRVSRTECVEIEVSLVDFANALFGRSGLPAVFRLRPDRVGLRREHKTVVIPLSSYPSSRDQAFAAAIVSSYEVDGWLGCLSDVSNHHRIAKKGDGWSVEVGFTRWVEPEPGWEPEP